jgi:nitroreductase
MGLGAVWMTGPLPQCKGEVEKILKVPATMDIVALIPVGYPAESPSRSRKPVSEVCEIIR